MANPILHMHVCRQRSLTLATGSYGPSQRKTKPLLAVARAQRTQSGWVSHHMCVPSLFFLLEQVRHPFVCALCHYVSGTCQALPSNRQHPSCLEQDLSVRRFSHHRVFMHLHPITAGVQKPSPITSVTRGLAPCWPEWATRPLTPKYSSAQRYMKRNSSHHRTLRGPLLHHLPFGSGGDREEGHLGAACYELNPDARDVPNYGGTPSALSPARWPECSFIAVAIAGTRVDHHGHVVPHVLHFSA